MRVVSKIAADRLERTVSGDVLTVLGPDTGFAGSQLNTGALPIFPTEHTRPIDFANRTRAQNIDVLGALFFVCVRLGYSWWHACSVGAFLVTRVFGWGTVSPAYVRLGPWVTEECWGAGEPAQCRKTTTSQDSNTLTPEKTRCQKNAATPRCQKRCDNAAMANDAMRRGGLLP